MNSLLIPASYGEVADKISILEIKSARMSDPAKLANVGRELSLLQAVLSEAGGGATPGFEPLYRELRQVNERLWTIEDDLRDCERRGEFGPTFVKLARSVYFTNDARSRIKAEINALFRSDIVEEKSYAPYARAGSPASR